MTREQQDLSWACLPKEARDHIRSDYEYYLKRYEAVKANTAKGAIDALEDLFGHHNLTSDTEPEEMLMVERKKVQELYDGLLNEKKAVSISTPYGGTVTARLQMLQELFGDKCLPDKPINGAIGTTPPTYKLDVKPEQPSVQVEPKFDIGDDVIFEGKPYKITGCQHFKGRITYSINIPNGEYKCFFKEFDLEPYTEPKPKFKVGDKVISKLDNNRICTVEYQSPITKLYQLNTGGRVVIHRAEQFLEPYTEPETRNLSQETANCDKPENNQLKDTMEAKELNLAELLKGCVGEWFYVLPCGEMELKEINKLELKTLHFSRDAINCFTKTDGRAYENGSCIIYPSRTLYEKYPLDAKAAWTEWQKSREPKRWTPQIGEHIFWVNANLTVSQDRFNDFYTQRKRRAVGNEFKTGKEAQQAAVAVREALQKFHEKNSAK